MCSFVQLLFKARIHYAMFSFNFLPQTLPRTNYMPSLLDETFWLIPTVAANLGGNQLKAEFIEWGFLIGSKSCHKLGGNQLNADMIGWGFLIGFNGCCKQLHEKLHCEWWLLRNFCLQSSIDMESHYKLMSDYWRMFTKSIMHTILPKLNRKLHSLGPIFIPSLM